MSVHFFGFWFLEAKQTSGHTSVHQTLPSFSWWKVGNMLQISDRPPNETDGSARELYGGSINLKRDPWKKNGWDSPQPIHIPQADWRGYAIISSYIRIKQNVSSPVCLFFLNHMLVKSPSCIGCFPWFKRKATPQTGHNQDLAEPYQVRPRNLPRKKSSPSRAAWDGHWSVREKESSQVKSLHFKRSKMSENKNQNVMI